MQASNITNPVTFATSKTRLTVFTNTVLLFLDMSFVSVKTERKLFVYNMHLKQLNLQQSMQLKCHYLGISGIKTKNKFIKCLTAWFHDQIRKNLQILLNISRRSKQRHSFYRKRDEGFYNKESLTAIWQFASV